MSNKDLRHSIEKQMAMRVQRSANGTVFTPSTFALMGSRAAIDKSLQRLVAQGILRRLARGWYDKPRRDALLGILWPTVDAVVKALVGKDKLRVQPTGVYAANLLGLSEQVPAKIMFLTDGTRRSIRVGPMQLIIKRTSPRSMATAGRLSGLVIQAFKSLGAAHITPERLAHLRKTLPAAERAKLPADIAYAPVWMQAILRDLALDEPGTPRRLSRRKDARRRET